MNSRRLGRLGSLLLALVWSAALSSALLTTSGETDVLVLLLLPPVLGLGLYWGRRGGLGGGMIAAAITSVAALLGSGDLAPIFVAVADVLFLATGLLVGWLADEKTSQPPADGRWFEMSNDLLVEASLDGYFTRLSEAWEDCLGWSREELMARPFREFVHPEDLRATNLHADALEVAPGEVVNFENRYRHKDGSYRWLMWCARSDHERKYAVARDITDRKSLEEVRLEMLQRVEKMAGTDWLTGLPNRRRWEEELTRAMAAAARRPRPLAVALIDLDDFKGFNDSQGHRAGDELLAGAAHLWQSSLRASDFLARYGGEEFAALLLDCDPGVAERLLERLRNATPESQTCSIGLAFYSPGDSPGELVARADRALYEAKHRGRNRLISTG